MTERQTVFNSLHGENSFHNAKARTAGLMGLLSQGTLQARRMCSTRFRIALSRFRLFLSLPRRVCKDEDMSLCDIVCLRRLWSMEFAAKSRIACPSILVISRSPKDSKPLQARPKCSWVMSISPVQIFIRNSPLCSNISATALRGIMMSVVISLARTRVTFARLKNTPTCNGNVPNRTGQTKAQTYLTSARLVELRRHLTWKLLSDGYVVCIEGSKGFRRCACLAVHAASLREHHLSDDVTSAQLTFRHPTSVVGVCRHQVSSLNSQNAASPHAELLSLPHLYLTDER